MAKLSTDFTRRMLAGHGWIGVGLGALIYVICMSGSLIVLVDQLSRWERPEAPVVNAVTADRIEAISEAALAKAQLLKLDHDIVIRPPSAEYPRLSILAIGEGERHAEWWVDADGLIGVEVELPFVEFVQALHFNLTAPGAIGRYMVGIIGAVLLASLVTGVLAHRRIIKDAFRLRWGGSRRRSNADLHNRIGVWALPFHLIVALTGSLLGLSGLIILVLALVAYRGDRDKAIVSLLGPQPTADARLAQLPDIRPMLAQIEASTAGAEITQVFYQHVATRGQIVQIAVAAPGHLARNEAYTFSGDGRLLAKAGYTDGNGGMRIYGMLTPLHYGTYGGLPLKLVYAALGTSLTLVVATGGNIWLSRRREQGRAAPGLERLWTTLTWGQPVILLMAAMLAPTGLPLVPFYWAMTLSGFALALRIGDLDVFGAALRIAAGLSAVALGVGHFVSHGHADAASTSIDLLLAIAGTLLVVFNRAGLIALYTRPARAAVKQ